MGGMVPRKAVESNIGWSYRLMLRFEKGDAARWDGAIFCRLKAFPRGAGMPNLSAHDFRFAIGREFDFVGGGRDVGLFPIFGSGPADLQVSDGGAWGENLHS